MNVGVQYMRLRDYDKALLYFREALVIFKHLYGDNHPLIGSVSYNKAIVCFNLGRYEEAADAYLTAFELYAESMGEDHPHTFDAGNGACDALAAGGNFRQAAEIKTKILNIQTAVLGNSHPLAVQTLYNLARIEAGGEMIAEALEHYALAAERAVEAFGAESNNTQIITKQYLSFKDLVEGNDKENEEKGEENQEEENKEE
uniref:Kinesin light chain n=1 Tax=Paramoeba aestuarina TaxID=180227 RepID=A0A7S4U9U0_9EUKA|mmetsp:Transcript_37465/g.59055  ORF Transcript_37465/g.59055 Transcript_37465/m.59055 type:complete len:201 (+) Transcript_37465:34-636(+)